MQSTSDLSPLSPAENLFRRLEYHGVELRNGQRKFVQFVNDNPKQSVYNGVLPTGYGKSKAAECVCDILKQQGRATRFLFVVPTDTQRTQYAEDIGQDVMNLGLNLRLMRKVTDEGIEYNVPVVISHTVANLRAHFENRCEVFVTTIQGIRANQAWYRDFMSKGNWCVFADEYQKLNREDKAKWGKALEALNYDVLFGLTATPIRTDHKDTVFANIKPNVEITLQEAYDERAIRRVIAHVEHYFVDILNEENEVERVTTETIDDYDISKQLRFTTKYYASMMSSAVDCLTTENHKHPGQHQMLVFAMSVAHARSVSDTMNTIYGNGFSEWIGVGPNGRPKEEIKDILKDYKNNKIPCLVQVDIATEGFNNPKSSILVFLRLMRKAAVSSVQGAGRGSRRNKEILNFQEDVCHMFASPDTEMAELIVELAQQTFDPMTIGTDTIPSDMTEVERATPLYTIGPFESTVQDSEYDRSEIISKIPQAEVDDLVDSVKQKTGEKVSDDRIRAILAEDRIERMKQAQAIEKPESQRQRVKAAQQILVGNVIRLRYGMSSPKSAPGDLHKLLNREWIKRSGQNHKSMLDEDFKVKHDWIQSINEKIQQTRQIPLWLQL